MVATLLRAEASSPEVAELLRPERLPNGTEPEERIILCGLSWQRYPALNKLELYRRFQVRKSGSGARAG